MIGEAWMHQRLMAYKYVLGRTVVRPTRHLASRFRSKRAAWRSTFGEWRERDDLRIVLEDLAQYCHADRSTNYPDTCCGRAELEGRRQVWLLIRMYIDLHPEEILEIQRNAYTGQTSQPRQKEAA